MSTLGMRSFIALIAALMALNALAIDVMLPALPSLGDALGVDSPNERQLVVSIYMIGFGCAQLVFGPLSDRFGRRRPLFAGIALYVVCASLAIFAPTFHSLLALRFVQGLGAAATRVIATSVVRDRFAGREMAQIMSLASMVFMVIPIVAPGVGQLILLVAPWHYIFLFMAVLATIIGTWGFLRLPETLHPEFRRALSFSVVVDGFRLVVTNRTAFLYGLSGMFIFSAMFAFVMCSQQVFVGIYGLGTHFPIAFACMAALMSVASFANSRLVQRLGMRRLSHTALLVYIGGAATWFLLSVIMVDVPLPVFFALVVVVQCSFGFVSSNMNALAMEPLGNVAGTAAAVFGFMQTVGGALIGTFIGQQFNGTLTPNAAGYLVMGSLVLCCVLVAERGRLFSSRPGSEGAAGAR